MLYWRFRCEWGTSSVSFGITYACFIPRILPFFAMGLWYQHRFFMFRISFEGHKQSLWRNPRSFKSWLGFAEQIQIKLGTSFIQGFLQLPFWCPLGSNLCKQNGGQSVTTEACTSLARVCVVWRSESSLGLSALCVKQGPRYHVNEHCHHYWFKGEYNLLCWTVKSHWKIIRLSYANSSFFLTIVLSAKYWQNHVIWLYVINASLLPCEV